MNAVLGYQCRLIFPNRSFPLVKNGVKFSDDIIVFKKIVRSDDKAIAASEVGNLSGYNASLYQRPCEF